MLNAIGNALTTIIGWVGTVVTSFTDSEGDLYALLPLFCIGIGVSALMLGIKAIRSFCWGN